MKLYWKNNPDKKKMYDKKYHAKNRDKNNKRSLEYYLKNRDSMLKKFKEYNINNKDKVMDSWRKGYQNRRARLAKVPSETYTRESIIKIYGNFCNICSTEIDMSKIYPDKMSFSFDHVIPLSVGGTNMISNIRPTHLTCNRKKAANNG